MLEPGGRRLGLAQRRGSHNGRTGRDSTLAPGREPGYRTSRVSGRGARRRAQYLLADIGMRMNLALWSAHACLRVGRRKHASASSAAACRRAPKPSPRAAPRIDDLVADHSAAGNTGTRACARDRCGHADRGGYADRARCDWLQGVGSCHNGLGINRAIEPENLAVSLIAFRGVEWLDRFAVPSAIGATPVPAQSRRGEAPPRPDTDLRRTLASKH